MDREIPQELRDAYDTLTAKYGLNLMLAVVVARLRDDVKNLEQRGVGGKRLSIEFSLLAETIAGAADEYLPSRK